MNSKHSTDEYLLLIRGTHWSQGLSPTELQRVMTDFQAWAEALERRGVHRGAQPLAEEGKLIAGPGGGTVTDGVFVESKDAIAGYFRLGVAAMAEAVQYARTCPLLDRGAQIEVRPVADLDRPAVAESARTASATQSPRAPGPRRATRRVGEARKDRSPGGCTRLAAMLIGLSESLRRPCAGPVASVRFALWAAAVMLGTPMSAAAPAPPPDGQYVSVNGLRMYYEAQGAGNPLVLLHGAFGFIEGWTNILPTLTRTHRVIAIELEGHGHTQDLDRPLRYEQMADDVAQLLQQLHIGSADFFGYSMGGTVALGVAIRHPELVRRLATYGSSAVSLGDTNQAAAKRQRFNLPADFAPPELKQPYDRTAPDPTRWPVLVAKVKSLISDFTGYPPADLSRIRAPVLIMVGDRDVVRPEQAVALYRVIPDAQLAVLPGSDHFLLWSNPGKALALLTPFFSDAAPKPQPQEHRTRNR